MMKENEIINAIRGGQTALGIELGSTRVKAVLIGPGYMPLASGGHDWENRFEQGVWTYSLADAWAALQDSYAKLAADVQAKYGLPLTNVGSIGISAMMHGYLPFGAGGGQLVPFRTWRNTITGQAAAKLSGLFSFNIPQRWTIAHLYQAMLNGEEHVKDIDYLTTLSGYIHWRLTGKRVVGVGEASGMFPVEDGRAAYRAEMVEKFNGLLAGKGFGWTLEDIFPRVLSAGEEAGSLTEEGAKLLDPTGHLTAGIPLCPPEGDAGTGMAATNSVAVRTGNVSAGTSIFAMAVLEKSLERYYAEIDMVSTPACRPVAMVHCNNCTSDLDAWVKLFAQALAAAGCSISRAALYDTLYAQALEGEADGGGLLSYNYLSGEHTTGFDEGRPLFARGPKANLTLPNFMRTLLYSTMATLKIGMELLDREGVQLDQLMGHGGLFKTEGVGQRLMAGALNVPVAVMKTAGEGGAWGIALLAAYLTNKKPGQSLERFLADEVFAGSTGSRMEPEAAISSGFASYVQRYKDGLAIERAAVEHLK